MRAAKSYSALLDSSEPEAHAIQCAVGPCVPLPRCSLPVSPMDFGSSYRCGDVALAWWEINLAMSQGDRKRASAIYYQKACYLERGDLGFWSARCWCPPGKVTAPIDLRRQHRLLNDEKRPRDGDAAGVLSTNYSSMASGSVMVRRHNPVGSNQPVSGTLSVTKVAPRSVASVCLGRYFFAPSGLG